LRKLIDPMTARGWAYRGGECLEAFPPVDRVGGRIVGYQSVAAFRRVFTHSIGMTPGEWCRQFRPKTGA
jgi:hypothetical protein